MDFTTDIFSQFDKKWALLTVGDKDKFNTMTISWGGLAKDGKRRNKNMKFETVLSKVRELAEKRCFYHTIIASKYVLKLYEIIRPT